MVVLAQLESVWLAPLLSEYQHEPGLMEKLIVKFSKIAGLIIYVVFAGDWIWIETGRLLYQYCKEGFAVPFAFFPPEVPLYHAVLAKIVASEPVDVSLGHQPLFP